jgi:hypothetical protein
VCRPSRALAVELTGDSDYLASTFRSVVEHIHKIVLENGDRRFHAKTALEILLTLVKKTSSSPINAPWINGLLEGAACGKMDDETFTAFLRFSALRGGEATTIYLGIPPTQGYGHVRLDEARITGPENPTPEYNLLDQVLRNIETCSAREDGWQDDAVYGGLITIGDIPGLGSYHPTAGLLQMLSKAMEKGEDQGETEGENQGRGDQGKEKGKGKGKGKGEGGSEGGSKGRARGRIRKRISHSVLGKQPTTSYWPHETHGLGQGFTRDSRGSRHPKEIVQRRDRNRSFQLPVFVPRDDGNPIGGQVLALLPQESHGHLAVFA